MGALIIFFLRTCTNVSSTFRGFYEKVITWSSLPLIVISIFWLKSYLSLLLFVSVHFIISWFLSMLVTSPIRKAYDTNWRASTSYCSFSCWQWGNTVFTLLLCVYVVHLLNWYMGKPITLSISTMVFTSSKRRIN